MPATSAPKRQRGGVKGVPRRRIAPARPSKVPASRQRHRVNYPCDLGDCRRKQAYCNLPRHIRLCHPEVRCDRYRDWNCIL